jgi:nitroreductase
MNTTLDQSMSVMETIYKRRAVRAYRPDPIDEETVCTLLDAAVRAPTAIHLEPWVFAVVQDRGLLARLSDRAKAAFLAGAATGESHAAQAHRDHPSPLTQPDFNIFYDAGTLIVICAKPMGQFVTADCWLAAENLMLAACALGLATCPIGFAIPILNDPEVKRELGIPLDVTTVAPIIVGVPRGETPATSRKPPEILCWRR